MARDSTIYDDRLVLLSEVDIFADLSPDEVEAIGKAAPMRVYEAAEALDEALVCVMSRADVHRFLLSDPRISMRIAEILGRRLKAMEQQYTDAVFKSVPQRIAATLCTLGDRAQGRRAGLIGGGSTHVALTHEQLAALVGTSRETATKALGDFAEQGLVELSRGKIFIIDRARLADEAGDQW